MENKVLSIILDACDNKIIYKNKDINLFDTGLLDSMNFIELLISLEEEFNIEIELAEINKSVMSTPNQLIMFIKSKVSLS